MADDRLGRDVGFPDRDGLRAPESAVRVPDGGILFALSLGHACLRAGFRFFAPLDGATYAIFLFSWFPQSALRVLLYDYGHFSPWIGVPLSTLAGMVLPWLVWKGLQYGKRWPAGRAAAGLLGQ